MRFALMFLFFTFVGCKGITHELDELAALGSSMGAPCASNDSQCHKRTAVRHAHYSLFYAPAAVVKQMGTAAREKSWEENLETLTSDDFVFCDENNECRSIEVLDSEQPIFTPLDDNE